MQFNFISTIFLAGNSNIRIHSPNRQSRPKNSPSTLSFRDVHLPLNPRRVLLPENNHRPIALHLSSSGQPRRLHRPLLHRLRTHPVDDDRRTVHQQDQGHSGIDFGGLQLDPCLHRDEALPELGQFDGAGAHLWHIWRNLRGWNGVCADAGARDQGERRG